MFKPSAAVLILFGLMASEEGAGVETCRCERKRVQTNCTVSVTMVDMWDGEGWTDMETI